MSVQQAYAGGLEMITPAALRSRRRRCHPGVVRFEVLPEEAHQTFQGLPGLFNVTVDAFWRQAQARGL